MADLEKAGLAELRTGPFGTQLHAHEYVDEGVPVINVRNLGWGNLRADTIECIDATTAVRLEAHRLLPGDIVFGRKGAVDRHLLIGQGQAGWIQGSDCLRLRIKPSAVLPRFLSYALRTRDHVRWMENQCSHGATMASLNQAIVSRIGFRLPDIGIQGRIAGILSAYDDLIENNLRRVKILEEMAQSLYKEWFVDFRFPGHESVKMVDSPLGMIPETWEVNALGKRIELMYGKSLVSKVREEGPYPVYGSGGVVGQHAEYVVNGPGVIVGRKGNVGAVYWADDPFFPIDTVYWVKTDLPLRYVYFNLKAQNFLNNDAAVPGLSRQQAYLLDLLVPADGVLGEFDRIVEPQFEVLRRLRQRNTVLRQTRDLLLPKLISGEIDVSDLDIDVGEDAA